MSPPSIGYIATAMPPELADLNMAQLYKEEHLVRTKFLPPYLKSMFNITGGWWSGNQYTSVWNRLDASLLKFLKNQQPSLESTIKQPLSNEAAVTAAKIMLDWTAIYANLFGALASLTMASAAFAAYIKGKQEPLDAKKAQFNDIWQPHYQELGSTVLANLMVDYGDKLLYDNGYYYKGLTTEAAGMLVAARYLLATFKLWEQSTFRLIDLCFRALAYFIQYARPAVHKPSKHAGMSSYKGALVLMYKESKKIAGLIEGKTVTQHISEAIKLHIDMAGSAKQLESGDVKLWAQFKKHDNEYALKPQIQSQPVAPSFYSPAEWEKSPDTLEQLLVTEKLPVVEEQPSMTDAQIENNMAVVIFANTLYNSYHLIDKNDPNVKQQSNGQKDHLLAGIFVAVKKLALYSMPTETLELCIGTLLAKMRSMLSDFLSSGSPSSKVFREKLSKCKAELVEVYPETTIFYTYSTQYTNICIAKPHKPDKLEATVISIYGKIKTLYQEQVGYCTGLLGALHHVATMDVLEVEHREEVTQHLIGNLLGVKLLDNYPISKANTKIAIAKLMADYKIPTPTFGKTQPKNNYFSPSSSPTSIFGSLKSPPVITNEIQTRKSLAKKSEELYLQAQAKIQSSSFHMQCCGPADNRPYGFSWNVLTKLLPKEFVSWFKTYEQEELHKSMASGDVTYRPLQLAISDDHVKVQIEGDKYNREYGAAFKLIRSEHPLLAGKVDCYLVQQTVQQ